MANSNGWGDGASNNNIGWGQGATNTINWGKSHSLSYAGLTNIVGAVTPPPPSPFVFGDFNFADGNTDYTTNTITFTKSGRLYIQGVPNGEGELSAFGYLNGQQMTFFQTSANALTYPNSFNGAGQGTGVLLYSAYYGVFDVSVGNTMYFNVEGGSPFGAFGDVSFKITSFTGTLIDTFRATKSGCYLTTAMVQYKGLLDDGVELTAMRALRDYYKGDVYYDNLIAEYYESSVAIIKGIESTLDPSLDYEFIYQSVLKVKDYVDQSMWVEGWNEYYETYLTLKNKYITNV